MHPTPRLLLPLLLSASCLLALGCPASGGNDPSKIDPRTVGAMPINVPIDTDLDGAKDLVRVADFDGDGRLEIVDDLQGALDTLDDVGAKLLVVEPGTFLPPLTCPTGSPCWCRLMPTYNTEGIACHTGTHNPRGRALLQLRSETTLRCAGRDVTTLAGWGYNDPNGPDANYALIGNADYSGGARHITVENCAWRGGGGAPYSSYGWHGIGRRGLDFFNVEDSTIRQNHASLLQHAGIFVESSRRVTIADNVLEKDGGYGNTYIYGGQSSIYIYNDSATPGSADHVIERNQVIDPGGNAVSLRNDFQDSGRLIERIEIRDIVVQSHGTGSCVLLRGTKGVHISNYSCSGTQFGFQLDPYATAFGRNFSNDDVLVEDLQLFDIVAPSGGSALYLAPYHSDVEFRDLVVDGAVQGACVTVRPPFRNVSITGFTLRDCGGHGIQFERNPNNSTINVVGRTPDEALRLENGAIRDVDVANLRDEGAGAQRAAIRFSTAGARYLVLRDISIDGVTGNAIELLPGMKLEDSTIDGLDVSRLAPHFAGIGPKSAHAGLACDAARADSWVIVTNAQGASDCNFAGPAGAASARCRCEGGVWRQILNHLPGAMISLSGSSVARNVFSNLLLHETGNEAPGYAFLVNGGGGVPYAGNSFSQVDVDDDLDGKTWGMSLAPGSADATNSFAGFHCGGSAAAHCLEGVPPGAVVLP